MTRPGPPPAPGEHDSEPELTRNHDYSARDLNHQIPGLTGRLAGGSGWLRLSPPGRRATEPDLDSETAGISESAHLEFRPLGLLLEFWDIRVYRRDIYGITFQKKIS